MNADSDSDEGMDFEGPTKFKTIMSVKFDWEKGGIDGWDELYSILDKDQIDPNMRDSL